MTKEELETLANNTSLENAINEGYPHNVKIINDLNPQMKEVRNEFVKLMAKNDYKGIKAVFEKKKKTSEDKEKIKAWRKSLNTTFKNIEHIIKPNENEDLIGKLVEKIVSIAQMLKYIGRNDLETRLQGCGITLDIVKLEDVNPMFADEDCKTLVKNVFSEVETIKEDIQKENTIIKKDCYEMLDSDIAYSQDNKGGLKSSDFAQLVKNKALMQLQDDDKNTKMMEKQREKNQANIDKNQLLLEANNKI